MTLNFGTTNHAQDIGASLSFAYGGKTIGLDKITIHYTEGGQNQSAQGGAVQSSSQSAPAQQPDPFAQQQQQMQQMMDQMNQARGQSSQQAVQNNQMAQDTAALKQQMAKQAGEQQQRQLDLQKLIGQDKGFQQMHGELLRKGYNITGGSINPISNDSGDFRLDYQDSNGNWANVTGSLRNATMQSLQLDTSEQQKQALEALGNDTRYKQMATELKRQGYEARQPQLSRQGNLTEISQEFSNAQNKTAQITATLRNNTVQKIELKKDGEGYPWGLLAIPLVAAALIFAAPEEKCAPRKL